MIGAGLLLLAATETAPPPAAPPRAPQYVIEVSGLLGPSYVLGAPLPNALSDQRVGLGGAVQLLFRSRYFISPFLDTGYALLSKGSARVPAGEPGGPGVVSDTLDAFHLTAGVAFDFWRLRLSAGAGFYFIGLRSSFAGDTAATREISIGSILGASASLLRARRFHLAADFVAHAAPEASLTYFTLGLSLHGDAISW